MTAAFYLSALEFVANALLGLSIGVAIKPGKSQCGIIGDQRGIPGKLQEKPRHCLSGLSGGANALDMTRIEQISAGRQALQTR